MEYKRLKFEDYFTICSKNWNNLDTDLEIAEYKSVKYLYRGSEYSAEYQVRFDAPRNCIQVILQQTSGKADWKVNFDFPAKFYDKFTFDNKLIKPRAFKRVQYPLILS